MTHVQLEALKIDLKYWVFSELWLIPKGWKIRNIMSTRKRPHRS